MADSSTPDQETPSTPPSKTRTIRDLYISANLYNPRGTTKLSSIDQEKLNKVAVIRWMGTLLYLPGTGFITGATIGTLKGTIEGVRAVRGSTDPISFRINKVLDSSIEGGMRIGGPLGMICLLYSTLEFGVAYKRKRFHPHDTINTVVAGFGTGALYKVISGQRRVAFSGVVGAVVAVTGKMSSGTCILISGLIQNCYNYLLDGPAWMRGKKSKTQFCPTERSRKSESFRPFSGTFSSAKTRGRFMKIL